MKRILVVSDCPTHPIIGGNRMCIMQYINLLKKMGYEICYLFVDLYNTSLKDKKDTSDYWNRNYFHYSLPRIQLFVQKIGQKFSKKTNLDNIDLYCPWGIVSFVNELHEKYHFHGIIINYIWLSKIMMTKIKRKIMFTHDVFSFRNERVKGASWFSFSPNEESKALRRCQNVFSIQDNESLYYSYIAPKSNIVTIYSTFDYVNLPICYNKNILFFSGCGSLNLNAIINFIYNVFPKILEKAPEVKLLIGGKICDILTTVKNQKNVELLGVFDNPTDFYKNGDIVINPVSEGTGLKIKTFEAIAHGKVVIADKHSLNGIYDSNKAPLYIVGEMDDYVDKIIYWFNNKNELLENKQKCKRYIEKLNNYIAKQYSKILM